MGAPYLITEKNIVPYKDPAKRAAYNAAYYQANYNTILRAKREYHQNNSDKRCETQRKYRLANLEKVNEANRKYRQDNREKVLKAKRESYQANTEKASWENMIQRCTNPARKDYKNYGALGVRVCKRWHKFENFLADMGSRPSKKHSLSRLGDVGNYEPGNVVWGDREHQAEQRRIKRERMAA